MPVTLSKPQKQSEKPHSKNKAQRQGQPPKPSCACLQRKIRVTNPTQQSEKPHPKSKAQR